MAHTLLTDLVTPSVFTGYSIERTKELTAFISSGIMAESGVLRNWMLSSIGDDGGSQVLTRPTWNDLDSTDATGIERIGTDVQSPLYTAGFGTAFPASQKITTHVETAVRVNRNNHWSASDLANAISGAKDPNDAMGVIGQLVGAYWARRLQKMVFAVVAGVLADNDAAPVGTEHVQGDLTLDVSGGGFVNGVTNFSAEGYFDALQTLGDAYGQIQGMAVHSLVHNRMRKLNLIDFRKDSESGRTVAYFGELPVIVDDSMPRTGFVCDTYLFGRGFLEYATVPPKHATSVVYRDEAGNGAGAEELWNRVQWCVHPMGHRFMGTPPTTGGGPSNAATANNLAHVDSWVRSAQSRKHIPFVRFRTREA